MKKHLQRAALVIVAAVAAAQLVRPNTVNPPIDPARTIQAHAATGSRLPAVLDRACADCHSNAAVWPWYTRVAPVSWAWARGINEARGVVNFSEWGTYSPEQRRALLAVSCASVSAGRMPGLYTVVNRKARLSAEDVNTICAGVSR